MSVFARLANLWKGFVSLWISDIEKEHPEIAYENAINSMVEKYSALKRATAAIIRRREETSERFYRRERRFGSMNRRIALPSTVVEGETKAELKDGVLTLRLPKSVKEQPRKIQIG